MQFTIPFDDVASGAVADTFATIVAARAADTAGYRFRLLKLTVGPSDNAPADYDLALQLKRVDDVSAGGAGTATSSITPTQRDSLSRASVITGGEDYTAEPTTYGTVLWAADMNTRTTLIEVWDRDEAPVVNRDQLIGLLAAPRSANAIRISGSMLIEEF